MQILPSLKPNDIVDLIAPASRCTEQRLLEIKELLTSWQLHCRMSDSIFGDDLLCANSDAQRLQHLRYALQNPESKAVICVRGGYGSMRLIPALKALQPPTEAKLFIGMSDITALNLFLLQKWQWPVIHAGLAPDKFSSESLNAVKSLLFAESSNIQFKGRALNQAAQKKLQLEAIMSGGNLCLLQTSIGTDWQLDAAHKIIFIEEVGERGYRVDRMLEHLHQAGLFAKAAAIVFGDFLGGEEPNGSSLIQSVLERFAKTCPFPVIQIQGVGHGYTNLPLIFGTTTILSLGDDITLNCATN